MIVNYYLCENKCFKYFSHNIKKNTFWDVSSPAEHRSHRHGDGVHPDENDHNRSFAESHRLSRHAMDDNVVPIIGDEDKGPQCSQTSDESCWLD